MADKKLIDYLTESVEADLKEEKANTYAVYLEILLEHLEERIYKNRCSDAC